ncbi:hypothetical protein IQ06DRAFT_296114 [Phaeosphaeriaceae sp. SRC1lsM3a]|nr:hypothetical protein IQ06DRAFT_296114 [Stagonospora sp. SRC1lsM3a]
MYLSILFVSPSYWVASSMLFVLSFPHRKLNAVIAATYPAVRAVLAPFSTSVSPKLRDCVSVV